MSTFNFDSPERKASQRIRPKITKSLLRRKLAILLGTVIRITKNHSEKALNLRFRIQYVTFLSLKENKSQFVVKGTFILKIVQKWARLWQSKQSM